MDIKVTITEKELHDFYIYGERLRQNPCKECPSAKNGSCCGCSKQSKWRDVIMSLPVRGDDWVRNVDIRNYINVLIDLNEIEKEINKLLDKESDLKDQVSELIAKFEVVDGYE